MATVELVTVSDDLDPRISNGVETVTFFNPIDGTKLEVELGEANQKHFMSHIEKLVKYINAARPVEQPAPVAKAVATRKTDSEAGKIREWAKVNGYDVGDRGRIKAEIVDAYRKAQGEVTESEPEVTSEVPVTEDVTTVDNEPEMVQTEQDSEDASSESEPTVTADDLEAMLAEHYAAELVEDAPQLDSETESK